MNNLSIPPNRPALVVGAGASAGGLDAFKRLLSALPDSTGMAFLLVQHFDSKHKSRLAELLAPYTGMSIQDADHGMELTSDTVYIIRPDTALAVHRGKIELSVPTLQRGVRLPVDHLFRSLAREYEARSVGIVLSGAGSDGSMGIRDIKSAGGLVIAQDPATSGQPSMPQSAINSGMVDLVLEIQEIPQALERFANLPPNTLAEPEEREQAEAPPERTLKLSDWETGQLAALLDAQVNFDLRVYKQTTVERRVLRRMALSGFDKPETYFDYLREHSTEQHTLVRDLLISVTDFFRDPDAFRALREMVIEPLVAQTDTNDSLRVWVPGCATGEEAYSIGMEFLDTINTHNKQLHLQIFATDIDQDAIAFARAAVYPLSIAEHIPEQRLQTYFKPVEDKGYRVRSPLRDVVTFAAHDLTKDPPFSRMNLVSCRNVLIYLNSEAQKHVLKVLHFALDPDGYLFLSTSESTGVQRELFSTLSKSHRVYRKIGASCPFAVSRSRNKPLPERTTAALPRNNAPERRMPAGADLARRAVLEAIVPPTIVVSEDGLVLFIHGELEPYLRIPQGDNPRLELGAMLRPEIATRTRGVLYKCRRNKAPVSAQSGAGSNQIRISARPAPTLGAEVVILSFESLPQEGRTETVQERPEPAGQESIIEQLEKELTATREDLRSTVEELERFNEELRIANEESMSMNEELQSANEELEATSEELRSLNEELTTVNAQLREKVDQLEQAHDDLHNFFASTKIATVFLDERLCIKRFTPASRELLGVDEADTGRYIGDIARELLQNGLERETKTVLDHLSTLTRELSTGDGRWISRQVLPYRTEHRRIEGVVVTFVDITDLKSATERLSLRERQQSVIARIGLHALRESNLQGFMEQVVRDVQQTLNTDFCKLLELQPGGQKLLLRAGVGWRPGLVGSTYLRAGHDSQSGYTLQSAGPVIVDDLATEKRFSGPPLLVEHGVVSGVTCVIGDTEHPYGAIGAHTRYRRTFTQEDANFLQAVASVIGSAINRHQTRMRLAVELGVVQVIAEATELHDTLPQVLENMTTSLSGSVGELWWLDDDRQQFVRRLFYVSPSMNKGLVEEQLERSSFAVDDGLAGRVYKEGHAQWCSDLGDPEIFMRHNAAKLLGLVSGFGLPVCAGNEVLGVISVFSTERVLADHVFLRSLDVIGSTVGDFIRRMESDKRTRLSEARKAAMVNTSLDSIVTIDSRGDVIEFNQAAQTLFGYPEEEAMGEEMASLIVPERFRRAHREGLARIIAGDAPRMLGRRIEMPAVRKDGSELIVELAITRIGDDAAPLFTSFIRDVTERKRMENALLEADRQKDEFLAMLGHELRNPLAAIRTAAELLKLTAGQDPGISKTQAIIERQSTHMAKLLDGILDVSRIIRGKINIEPRTVDLAAVCRDVVSDVTQSSVGTRRLDIRTDIPAEPVWIEADPVRLAQIIDNLLTNAIKYTNDDGRITVGVQRESGAAALKVSDTGVGIEPELLPHIFEVFRQSKQNLDRSHGGLGLGLALVKTLTEMHGGSVEARSAGKNKGAEFIVRLPASQRIPAKKADSSSEQPSALRILLIEDNEDSAEMLREVLELSGHEVMLATRAQQGIDMAQRRKADIVLCDIGLPDGMSGFDVARALRDNPRTLDLSLVALTGYGREEDKLRCIEAGFDAHLSKPIDFANISRVLEELRHGSGKSLYKSGRT
ncbi:MAG TPA: chemotaxis protein CheB [Gammaproteobacteria bacterium]